MPVAKELLPGRTRPISKPGLRRKFGESPDEPRSECVGLHPDSVGGMTIDTACDSDRVHAVFFIRGIDDNHKMSVVRKAAVIHGILLRIADKATLKL